MTKPAAVPPVDDRLIQLGSLTEAVHDPPLQPPGLATTVNTVVPPDPGTVCAELGVAEKVQDGTAAPA